MNELWLQNELCRQLQQIFAKVKMPNPSGDMVPIKIFKQVLPFIDYNAEADGYVKNTPSCCVFVASTETVDGQRSGFVDDDKDDVYFIFTAYDKEHDGQGHIDIFNLMCTLRDALRKNPGLVNHYYCSQRINLMVDARESAPFFEGTLSTSFKRPIQTPIPDDDFI